MVPKSANLISDIGLTMNPDCAGGLVPAGLPYISLRGIEDTRSRVVRAINPSWWNHNGLIGSVQFVYPVGASCLTSPRTPRTS
ncbi:unnamed protein product [Rodentolepis nana]|uniref:Ald_Xan_dh_C2 domain-containing protein n=1 Tax=Rodentolepis nana TaxID=102285 RepID=A0A0R3T7D3_RODNA|nr:unnamed protein product [Rodentolepis nana]